MLSFSFTVGNADDARAAAEVCDFLAERLSPGAVPAKRTRSSSKAADPVQLPNDKQPEPAGVGEAPGLVVPTVSDPAALYAALSGAAPVPEASPPVVAETRDDKVAKVRDLVKKQGGKWFSDYIAHAKTADVKLSDYSDDQLAALLAAATTGVIPS